jgi:hypothetical protein
MSGTFFEDKPMDKKRYRKSVDELRFDALALGGAVCLNVPGEPKAAFTRNGASRQDNDILRAVTEAVSNVMYCFNELQRAMDLPSDHPSHYEAFLRGRCGRCDHLDGPLPASDVKPTKAPKPMVVRESKRSPVKKGSTK